MWTVQYGTVHGLHARTAEIALGVLTVNKPLRSRRHPPAPRPNCWPCLARAQRAARAARLPEPASPRPETCAAVFVHRPLALLPHRRGRPCWAAERRRRRAERLAAALRRQLLRPLLLPCPCLCLAREGAQCHHAPHEPRFAQRLAARCAPRERRLVHLPAAHPPSSFPASFRAVAPALAAVAAAAADDTAAAADGAVPRAGTYPWQAGAWACPWALAWGKAGRQPPRAATRPLPAAGLQRTKALRLVACRAGPRKPLRRQQRRQQREAASPRAAQGQQRAEAGPEGHTAPTPWALAACPAAAEKETAARRCPSPEPDQWQVRKAGERRYGAFHCAAGSVAPRGARRLDLVRAHRAAVAQSGCRTPVDALVRELRVQPALLRQQPQLQLRVAAAPLPSCAARCAAGAVRDWQAREGRGAPRVQQPPAQDSCEPHRAAIVPAHAQARTHLRSGLRRCCTWSAGRGAGGLRAILVSAQARAFACTGPRTASALSCSSSISIALCSSEDTDSASIASSSISRSSSSDPSMLANTSTGRVSLMGAQCSEH